MTNVVLDTNVLISAILTPGGIPAEVTRLVSDDANMHLYYSMGIFSEYKRVLAYERLNFSAKRQDDALQWVIVKGTFVQVKTSILPLPDESDRIFYDTAKAVNAYLVTGNLKHYPQEPHIVPPARFVEVFV